MEEVFLRFDPFYDFEVELKFHIFDILGMLALSGVVTAYIVILEMTHEPHLHVNDPPLSYEKVSFIAIHDFALLIHFHISRFIS